MIAGYVSPLLKSVEDNGEYYEYALELFRKVSNLSGKYFFADDVPENSVFREFIGMG